MNDPIPFPVAPMLATLVDEPFHLGGWIFEEKYDGYRILACKRGRRVELRSRNGIDRNRTFPEIAEAVAALPARTAVLDGEVVGFDEHLVSRFQLIGGGGPLVYVVFDCLYLDGRDLRARPLSERREALEGIVGNTDRLFLSRRLARNGLGAYRAARRHGYEGVVAKDLASAYVSGRSSSWRKVKVGSGFTGPDLSRLALLLARQKRARSPFAPAPRQPGVTWLKPKYVAQIEFQEWTNDRKLRQPVFLGLRDDKDPSDCRLPENARGA